MSGIESSSDANIDPELADALYQLRTDDFSQRTLRMWETLEALQQGIEVPLDDHLPTPEEHQDWRLINGQWYMPKDFI